jgi:hypothetical protein
MLFKNNVCETLFYGIKPRVIEYPIDEASSKKLKMRYESRQKSNNP